MDLGVYGGGGAATTDGYGGTVNGWTAESRRQRPSPTPASSGPRVDTQSGSPPPPPLSRAASLPRWRTVLKPPTSAPSTDGTAGISRPSALAAGNNTYIKSREFCFFMPCKPRKQSC